MARTGKGNVGKPRHVGKPRKKLVTNLSADAYRKSVAVRAAVHKVWTRLLGTALARWEAKTDMTDLQAVLASAGAVKAPACANPTWWRSTFCRCAAALSALTTRQTRTPGQTVDQSLEASFAALTTDAERADFLAVMAEFREQRTPIFWPVKAQELVATAKSWRDAGVKFAVKVAGDHARFETRYYYLDTLVRKSLVGRPVGK